MAWKYQDNSRGNQTLGQVAINLVPKHLRDKIFIFRAKRSEVKLRLATYPYAIKKQRKVRNAPSRGLWVP